MDELGQPAGAVALGAAGRNLAVGVPVAERHGVAGEVPGVVTAQSRHVYLDLGAQVLDRVVDQFDDVLAVVGEGPRVLDGHLVVVGRLEQAGGPGAERHPGAVCLIGRAITVGIGEPVRIGGAVVDQPGAGDVLGIRLHRGVQDFLQARRALRRCLP